MTRSDQQERPEEKDATLQLRSSKGRGHGDRCRSRHSGDPLFVTFGKGAEQEGHVTAQGKVLA